MGDRSGGIGRRALLKSAGVAASAVVVGVSSIGFGREEDLDALQTDEGPTASEIAWRHDYGGDRAADASLRHLAQTDAGGYVLAGDDATAAGSGSTDGRFVLVRAAPDGSGEWEIATTGDVSGAAHASGVTRTGDGGFAVVGRLETPEERLGVAIKFDGEGEREWLETVGTLEDEPRVSVADCAPADGGVVVCGRDDDRAWLAKFGTDGGIEWEHAWTGDPQAGGGGVAVAAAHSVAARDDGGYHLFTRQGPSGRRRYFAVTVDGSGAIERRVVLDVRRSRTTAHPGFVRTADGGYAYSGREGDVATLTALGPDGDGVWHRSFDGLQAGSDRGVEVVRTSDGGLAVAGLASDSGSDGRAPTIVKIDAAGEKQWRRRYGEAGGTGVDALVETDDGGYAFLGGTTLTKLTPDDVPESGEDDTPGADGGSRASDEGTVTRG